MPYKPTIIRNFKGLSQKIALTSGSPEFALNCVNVLPSVAGLAKLRVPQTVSASALSGGPDQFGEWEGTSTKGLLAFNGQDINFYTLDDFVPSGLDSQPQYAGPVPWSTVLSNNTTFMQNGLSTPLKYNGIEVIPGDPTSTLQFWGIQVGATPTIGTPGGGTLSLAIGRSYRVAYKNADTGHVGTASPASASTGPLATNVVPVTIPAPIHGADGQITQARLYATLDGGADYFFHSQVDGPFPVVVNDETADVDLDQSERAPLINDVPPVAKYLARWGGRIFMFNLPNENPKWIAYTGFNRVFVGRPEETCPPGNRIKLDTGADDMAGGGIIPAGIIAFDVFDKMYMFRGQPEDIVVDAPVEFSLFMQELPYDIGCASHHTIQSTSRGLVWLGACLGIYMFDGSGAPEDISEGAEPIIRSINMTAIGNSRSLYWQYRGRDWYILAIATGNESQLNTILIVDLDTNEEKNFGIVPLDVGTFQSIGVVGMLDGTQKLIIGQGGVLKEIAVTPTTKSGIEENISATSASLGAFWQCGYIGNDDPTAVKFFRWGRVTADQAGIRVKRRLIDQDVTNPRVIEFVDTPVGGKFTTNAKARRMSYELRFRDEDVSQNILELVDVNISVAVR